MKLNDEWDNVIWKDLWVDNLDPIYKKVEWEVYDLISLTFIDTDGLDNITSNLDTILWDEIDDETE